LAAIYGPVPLELVVEYLMALEEVRLVERVAP
jgi:predicted transcriptional regulator